MAVDFDALVLAPAMATFARPMAVTPVKSQPGAPAYPARGVWTFRPVQIQLEDGRIQSTNEAHLGIRLAEFTVPPAQLDTLVFDGRTYEIADATPDGQGGADLKLRLLGDDA